MVLARAGQFRRDSGSLNLEMPSANRRLGIFAKALLVAGTVGLFFINGRERSGAGSSKSLTPPAQVMESSGLKDPVFFRFKGQFLGQQLGYKDAKSLIEKGTGVALETPKFSLGDSYLLRVKKFYTIFIVPHVFPGSVEPVGSADYFETHASRPNDGRVRALAEYILAKYGPSQDPKIAAEAIAGWVNANVDFDIDHYYARVPSDADIDTFIRLSGRGSTNNHKSTINALLFGGLCGDYVNTSLDLLNAVGIPARLVQVTASGLLQSAGGQTTVQITHALLEVQLPSKTVYYDVTPRVKDKLAIRGPVIEVSDPGEYAKQLFSSTYPDADPSRLAVVSSLPSEVFDDDRELQALFDRDIRAVDEVYRKIMKDPAKRRRFTNAMKKYNNRALYFQDKFFDEMHLAVLDSYETLQ